MQRIEPSLEFVAQANLSVDQYKALQAAFQANPSEFWAKLARDNLYWHKPFSKIFTAKDDYKFAWFEDALTNISFNCLDRHLSTRFSKTAIIFEGERGDSQKISYGELHEMVCKLASGLLSIGIKKGDPVIVYMPLSIQAVITMQALERIGAVHSVVFAGFSVNALRDRIIDLGARHIITTNAFYRKGEIVKLLPSVFEASQALSCTVVSYCRVADFDYSFPGLVNWDDLLLKPLVEPIWCEAEHPSFVLYTSGSTGKPKGIQHSTAGYLLWAKLSTEWIFDLKDEDIFWCTADIGWITGHTYLVYGPLASGKTIFIYEGAPNYPNPSRFWQLIDKYGITVFYTAPTAIRSFMLWGSDYVKGSSLETLRLLASVGEPINPAAWFWYYEHIGKNKCPIVDTWWQTETGGIMLSTLPGVHLMQPGSAGLPLPGVKAFVDSQNLLYIKDPLPSMARTIHKDHDRFVQTYWSSGFYKAGDAAILDEHSYLTIMGRVDDVINVSGHRLGTAEIESALVAHEDVVEAAVISIPHELKGEAIIAFVVIYPQSGTDLEAKLKEQVVAEIGSIARPEKICILSALPKTRSGKIMRRLLKDYAMGNKPSGDLSTLDSSLDFKFWSSNPD